MRGRGGPRDSASARKARAPGVWSVETMVWAGAGEWLVRRSSTTRPTNWAAAVSTTRRAPSQTKVVEVPKEGKKMTPSATVSEPPRKEKGARPRWAVVGSWGASAHMGVLLGRRNAVSARIILRWRRRNPPKARLQPGRRWEAAHTPAGEPAYRQAGTGTRPYAWVRP